MDPKKLKDKLIIGKLSTDPSGEDGAVYFNTTSSEFKGYKSGAWGSLGGASGLKNQLTESNSKFEGGVGSWVTYDDGGASATPVDGTGGSPSTLTLSGTTTAGEILEGIQSLKVAKSAADGQGEGLSVLSKTLDRADYGKPHYIYFSYDASHASYVSGDVKVYAYDVTNSVLLTVYNDSSAQLLKQKAQFSGVIFPQDTCASIRLILHVTTTNASAYDIFLDEVVITPQAVITGPAMSDWIDAGTTTWTGSTTNPTKGTTTIDKFMYRQVGSNMEFYVAYKHAAGGAAGSGDYSLATPAGIQLDTTKITVNASVIGAAFAGAKTTFGTGNMIVAATTFVGVGVYAESATKLKIQTSSGVFSSGVASFANNPVDIELFGSAPVLGWTQGATLSSNSIGVQTAYWAGYHDTDTTWSVTNTAFTDFTADATSTFTERLNKNFGTVTSALSGGNKLPGIVFTPPKPGAYLITANISGLDVDTTVVTGAIRMIDSASNTISEAGWIEGSQGHTASLSGIYISSTGAQETIKIQGRSTSNTVRIHPGATNSKAISWTIVAIPDFTVFAKQNIISKTTYLKDVKANTTAGGTFTSGAYQTRTLNTQEGDVDFCSLSANQFTLQPGTYEIEAWAPAESVTDHKAKLRNITDSSDTIIGTNEVSAVSNSHITHSKVIGRITITSSKIFELMHRCASTVATNGFGKAMSFGDSEVYSVVKIEKIY